MQHIGKRLFEEDILCWQGVGGEREINSHKRFLQIYVCVSLLSPSIANGLVAEQMNHQLILSHGWCDTLPFPRARHSPQKAGWGDMLRKRRSSSQMLAEREMSYCTFQRDSDSRRVALSLGKTGWKTQRAACTIPDFTPW